jgi:hypothetical protein
MTHCTSLNVILTDENIYIYVILHNKTIKMIRLHSNRLNMIKYQMTRNEIFLAIIHFILTKWFKSKTFSWFSEKTVLSNSLSGHKMRNTCTFSSVESSMYSPYFVFSNPQNRRLLSCSYRIYFTKPSFIFNLKRLILLISVLFFTKTIKNGNLISWCSRIIQGLP